MPKQSEMPRVSKAADERVRKERIVAAQVTGKRARTALAADKMVGKGQKRLSVAERGRHQEALKAADHEAKRLGAAPSRDAVTKPGSPGKKKKSTPESRRKPFEKLLPGDTARKLKGVEDLMTAGRKAGKGG